jgi:hypothetical protein
MSDWNQVQRLLVRWQRKSLLHRVILKSADGHGAKIQGNRLK